MSPAFLYLDDSMLVVDKPSGLLAVPGRGEAGLDNQASRVQAAVADALVVHRLDMSTSGLMLFARGKDMQRRLSHAFAQREVHKEYIAVVDGLLAADRGEIDLPLLTDWPNRPKQKVDFADGKPALTRYTVLERDALRGTTRVLLEPVTGRSHQLRVHLLAIGHPIAGDALYAPPEALAKAPRLLLHAQSLALPHPVDGRPMRFHSPAPF
jgi:tRNA pseudouridine32 synthase / 23S rRNA pseudouridine746 synthase